MNKLHKGENETVYVVAFVGKEGIGDIYTYPSKRAAIRAKKDWDAKWVSSEEAVVYKATLERVTNESRS